MKLDELIKCPHCGDERYYIFYDNAENIECCNCEKTFDIELETKVVVIATIPKRICCICNNEFISNGYFEEDIECPKCNFKGGHYKVNKR